MLWWAEILQVFILTTINHRRHIYHLGIIIIMLVEQIFAQHRETGNSSDEGSQRITTTAKAVVK